MDYGVYGREVQFPAGALIRMACVVEANSSSWCPDALVGEIILDRREPFTQ